MTVSMREYYSLCRYTLELREVTNNVFSESWPGSFNIRISLLTASSGLAIRKRLFFEVSMKLLVFTLRVTWISMHAIHGARIRGLAKESNL